ncbi:MAG: glycosyltransferase family 39 protein [Bacteroidota bacterium]
MGWLATSVFGDSIFALRFFPAIAGCIIVLIIGLMAKELGGKKWAIILACLAYILSPAFLRTNTLFQPVCFNQMWWTVAAFIFIKIINSNEKKYWYFLGIAVGLGWLTKYSIAFFMAAILISVFLTENRKWLSTKYPYIAFGIAFLIALPNICWQYKYGFPVIQHMNELASTQLVNVNPIGFIKSQLMGNASGVLIWIPGLIWLLFSKQGKPYRLLGFSYIFLILILIALSGKSYYAFGVYPMLMAAGGVAVSTYLEHKKNTIKYLFATCLIIPLLLLVPKGLPILPKEKLAGYFNTIKNFGYGQRWEDGKYYPLPQDFSDMFGWEEMAQKVAKKYHSLPAEKKSSCIVWGGSYAHTSTLNFYKKKYNLPEIFTLHSSYILFIEPPPIFDNLIIVDDVWSDSSSYFFHHEFVDSIENKYAREKGYIFYRDQPRINVDSAVIELLKNERAALFEE